MTNQSPNFIVPVTAYDLPPTTEFLEAVAAAEAATSIRFQDYIGVYTGPDTALHGRILIESQGSWELAGLLIQYDKLLKLMNDPESDLAQVQADLDIVSDRVANFRFASEDQY